MAKDRYSDTEIIDNRHYGTWRLPTNPGGLKPIDLLDGVKTTEHVFSRGERLDHLAAKFWNEESYWWIIALVNGIKYPFASGGLVPGLTLKIPVEPKDVLEKILK